LWYKQASIVWWVVRSGGCVDWLRGGAKPAGVCGRTIACEVWPSSQQ
jgi:hypothetical protein